MLDSADNNIIRHLKALGFDNEETSDEDKVAYLRKLMVEE